MLIYRTVWWYFNTPTYPWAEILSLASHLPGSDHDVISFSSLSFSSGAVVIQISTSWRGDRELVGWVLCCTWLQIVIELREADKFLDFSSIRLVHSCVHSAMMARPQHEDVHLMQWSKRSSHYAFLLMRPMGTHGYTSRSDCLRERWRSISWTEHIGSWIIARTCLFTNDFVALVI